MTTLYISDMDGTLLSTDSRVSPETSAILNQVHRDGALFGVATARTPATVEPLLHATGTIPLNVVMTGASLWDRGKQQYTNTMFIDRDVCKYVADTLHGHGLHPFVYTLDSDALLHAYHNGDLTSMDRKFIDDRRGLRLKRFHVDDPAGESGVIDNTVLFFAMGPGRHVFPAAAELEHNREFPTSVSAYTDIWGNDVGIIEVKAPGTSKADSVAGLKRCYKADRLVVFGDNLNDLSMMEIADVAVAVGNAVDEVKAKADIIIGPNSADSVARFVHDDFYSTH